MRWEGLTVVAILVCAACDSGGRGAPSDATPEDPECHGDCFGEIACAGGIQTIQNHAPIPCDEPPYPYCPMTEFECPGGCRMEGFWSQWGWPEAIYQRWLCLAEPDAVEGDLCIGDPDCWPVTAVDAGDGLLTTAFLECSSGGVCVPAIGPELGDLWQPCAAPTEPPTADELVVAIDDPPGYEIRRAPACLMHPSTTCLRAARTQVCWGDWDCADGAFCEMTTAPPVCRPGPRSPIVVDDLPCALPPS